MKEKPSSECKLWNGECANTNICRINNKILINILLEIQREYKTNDLNHIIISLKESIEKIFKEKLIENVKYELFEYFLNNSIGNIINKENCLINGYLAIPYIYNQIFLLEKIHLLVRLTFDKSRANALIERLEKFYQQGMILNLYDFCDLMDEIRLNR